MQEKISIRFFNDREVRAVWDGKDSRWLFSVLDIVLVLRDEDDYQKTRKKEAVFCKKFPFRRYAIHDNRFITGQNPMSGGEVAKVFLDVLENRGF